MQQNNCQDVSQSQLFTLIKGQTSGQSQEIVLECTEFQSINKVDSFAISQNQCKIISIEEEFYIKQWKVKSLKRDFIFKSTHQRYFPIRKLQYLKNPNYFYLSNSKLQFKFIQVNNGKIKQIWSMKCQSFHRQIIDEDNFIFIAIPQFILQYCKYKKKPLRQYQIDNSFNSSCFDYCLKEKILVSYDHKNIKVWLTNEDIMIDGPIKPQNKMHIHLKLNQRQIYILQSAQQVQQFQLWIYQITQDNKQVISISSIKIDNFMQYICKVYSIENIYNMLEKNNFLRLDCQKFSIQYIDNQFKYLAIFQRQIYIRNKNSNYIRNQFMSVK